MSRGGFSWKRATGVTRTKQRISRQAGIPLTKSGRQRKVGKLMTGGGCLLPAIALVTAALIVACSPPAEAPRLVPAAATVAPTRTLTPEPTRAPDAPAVVYYENCAAVRSAGQAPLRRDDPGYRAGLDRDDDGIACE